VTKFGRIQTKIVSQVAVGLKRCGLFPNHKKLFNVILIGYEILAYYSLSGTAIALSRRR
jgi:hypothetical protein